MRKQISRRQILETLAAAASVRALCGQQGQSPQQNPPPPESQQPQLTRPAQSPSGQQGESSTFSTDVKVVNVFATVRDKKGAIVHNLTKTDFVLDEDGRPETIAYFSQESNLPLTLGLLVDTSGSQRRC